MNAANPNALSNLGAYCVFGIADYLELKVYYEMGFNQKSSRYVPMMEIYCWDVKSQLCGARFSLVFDLFFAINNLPKFGYFFGHGIAYAAIRSRRFFREEFTSINF